MVNYQNGRIYLLTHVSGRCYIGSTTQSLSDRKSTHITFGFGTKHKNSSRGDLYPFMFGTQRHEWTIVLLRLCPCNSKEELEAEEYREMQAYPDQDKLLNVQRQQGVAAESTRQKQVINNTGRTHSDEAKALMSAIRLGVRQTPIQVQASVQRRRAASQCIVYENAHCYVAWREYRRGYDVRRTGTYMKRFGPAAADTTEEALRLAIAYADEYSGQQTLTSSSPAPLQQPPVLAEPPFPPSEQPLFPLPAESPAASSL